MKFDWDETARSGFRKAIVKARHDGADSPRFTDAGLAELLDAYPRTQMGLYTFPPHGEGRVKALHGEAPHHSGADLIKAVKSGSIWLNLRAVNKVIPAFSPIAADIFDQIEAATGERVFKRDAGLLISSPNIHVHYHLDIPMVCLVQLRGEKTLHLYPAETPFAPPDQIEAVALREREEEVAFQDTFEAACQPIRLKPGEAVMWPQNAPHRVQNGNMMNVSLSCEFMTPAALLRANAIYANGVLRRRFGWSPRLPEAVGPNMVFKAGLARVFKKLRPPPDKGPTPISFELEAGTDRIMSRS